MASAGADRDDMWSRPDLIDTAQIGADRLNHPG
jgi:hypothetical protein